MQNESVIVALGEICLELLAHSLFTVKIRMSESLDGDVFMHYSLHRPEQKEHIIALFQQTFTDSEGENEGVLIAKLVTDFMTGLARTGVTS